MCERERQSVYVCLYVCVCLFVWFVCLFLSFFVSLFVYLFVFGAKKLRLLRILKVRMKGIQWLRKIAKKISQAEPTGFKFLLRHLGGGLRLA